MNGQVPPLLRDEGLTFFGRIVAAQSHEVTNVLNVINELAGLQLDLLSAGLGGAEVSLQRLSELAERVQRQVQRGEQIVRNVNRFAHSVDLPVALFDLREVVASVVALGERGARLSRTRLVADLPPGTIALEGSSFRLQQALMACVDVALAAAAERRCVTVTCRLLDDGAEVEVASADPMTCPDQDRLAVIRRLVGELGAVVAAEPGAGDVGGFRLRVPQPRPARPPASSLPSEGESHGH